MLHNSTPVRTCRYRHTSGRSVFAVFPQSLGDCQTDCEADRRLREHALCPTCRFFRHHDTHQPASATRLSRWDQAARGATRHDRGRQSGREEHSLCKLYTNRKC